MIAAQKVIRDASIALFDEDFVRWTVDEIAGYIDEAVKTIVMAKPSAASAIVTLTLVAGTKQSLPANQRIKQLLDIIRNVQGTGGTAGRAIRVTTRAELDANEPRWHDSAKVPFRKEVRQFVYDETIPDTFFVVPGNDATGRVEASVSKLPTPLLELVTIDRDKFDSWASVQIGLDEIYEPAIKQHVLFSAFSKEEPAASPERAATHFQAFATLLGIKSQVEAASAPKRKST